MSEPYIGQIIMFGGNFAIQGYAMCDGQILSIPQNTALFSILGTTYGGNGTTTFGLPDLRGRLPMHVGQGPGLTPHSLGEKSGQENVTLAAAQMPTHNHPAQGTAKGSTSSLDSNSPQGKVLGTAGRGTSFYGSGSPDVDMATGTVQVTVENTGGNQPHSNMPPYQVVNFQIALQGMYPPRD
jgi:microcystin-dependent protein